MKDQFVTYEIAKRLKELKFNEECLAWYLEDTLIPLAQQNKKETSRFNGVRNCDFISSNQMSAPLWQQAIDWLRKKHRIVLNITPAYDWSKWNITSYVENNQELHSKLEDHFFAGDLELLPSYEQAREVAITKTLKLITTPTNV